MAAAQAEARCKEAVRRAERAGVAAADAAAATAAVEEVARSEKERASELERKVILT